MPIDYTDSTVVLSPFLSGAYFDVDLAGIPPAILVGRFTSVTGLSMEVEYETYNEGGANYPRHFFKGNKPQVLVLEQGIMTTVDNASLLIASTSIGASLPMSGTIILYDSFGEPQRSWSIVDARIQKYVGPELNANQPALAVSRIELVHNGCY